MRSLLAEILRAINLAQLQASAEVEVEAEIVEDDDSALFQLGAIQGDDGEAVQSEKEDQTADEVV